MGYSLLGIERRNSRKLLVPGTVRAALEPHHPHIALDNTARIPPLASLPFLGNGSLGPGRAIVMLQAHMPCCGPRSS
jgi:hypothetical protein